MKTLHSGSSFLMDGAELIAEERGRHRDDWSAEHDDKHVDGALAIHGAELAVCTTYADIIYTDAPRDSWGLLRKHRGDRIRQLTIAGALIAAEIDRLQRARKP